MKIIMKHYVIGEILENGEIVRGATHQGMVYKNSKAFYEKSDEVCYIPELRDYRYNYQDFLDIAHGSEEVAQSLFNIVDWQSPENQINDWLDSDEVHLCTKCKKMFESYEVENCPYCNQKKED